MTRSIAVRCAAVAVALTITGAATAQHPHVLVPADKVMWGPALPAGAQISVIEGDPGQKARSRCGCSLPPTTPFYVNPADDPQRKNSNR